MIEIKMKNIIRSFVIAFIHVLLSFTISSSTGDNICGYNAEGKSVCCAYHYKLSGECIKCPLGSTGLRCDRRCQFPQYGELCLEKCNCSRKLCHFAFGCFDEVANVSTSGPELTPHLSKSTHSRKVIQDSSFDIHVNTTLRNKIQINSADQELLIKTLIAIIISIGTVLIVLLIAILIQKQLFINHNVRRRKHISDVTDDILDYYETFDPNTRENDQTNYTYLQSNNEANRLELSTDFNIVVPIAHNESSRYDCLERENSLSSKSSSAYTEIMT